MLATGDVPPPYVLTPMFTYIPFHLSLFVFPLSPFLRYLGMFFPLFPSILLYLAYLDMYVSPSPMYLCTRPYLATNTILPSWQPIKTEKQKNRKQKQKREERKKEGKKSSKSTVT
ncbi:hypothetical protein F4776DRAFT_635513 [Hypoxylon sp. NC0597]|nr:hypothetical protein F4776DRAFT_635513 [Hypoxylon sp. NC0597]